MALNLFSIAGMGVAILHAPMGWFCGEYGGGGMEYSLSLMVALRAITAADAQDPVVRSRANS